jgi:hypothetical protein
MNQNIALNVIVTGLLVLNMSAGRGMTLHFFVNRFSGISCGGNLVMGH